VLNFEKNSKIAKIAKLADLGTHGCQTVNRHY